ncbi:MAG: right-handed parallel beta-helix repeat-containing protein, partial [Ignavibacteria bacterium]
TENIGSIISVKDITIYRNSITYCSQQIPDIPADMLKEVGFGGIALSDCENAVIQENRIEDNGINSDDPICGIFILYGEKIDIINNRILNNGQKSSTKVGQRGGIVISMSFEKLLSFLLEGEEAFVPDGIPAIKINNNIVTQPFGRALIVIACGLISIAGNHFTTQECDCSINKNSFLAATVFIFNLGISKDLLERFFPSFHNLPNVQVAASPRNYSTSYSTRITETESMEIELVQNIFNLPGGNVLFVNNQTSLDLRHSDQLVCFSSQLIASLDDVALNSNYTECSSLNSKAIINTTVAAISVRTNDNRFQESFNASVLSLFSVGMMNTALGNQSTHCLLVLPPAARVEENNIVLFPDPCRNYQQSIGQRLAAYKEKESK